MLRALKNWLRLRLRYPLAVLARTLPLPFLPRRRLSRAHDVDPSNVRIDSIPSVHVVTPPLPEPHETEFRTLLAKGQYVGEATIPERSVWSIGNATVVMPESVAMQKGRILSESLPFDHFLDTVLFIKDWFRARPTQPATPNAGFLITITHARNYHLWIHFALPRLLFWERLPDRANVVALVPDEAPRFITDALDLYRARQPEFRYEKVSRSNLTLDRLIVAEPMSVEDLPNPLSVEWLRRTFLPAAPSVAGRSILISRKGALEREILNEDELLATLRPLGFERFDPANATFEEQIRVFSSARRIVAPHGAALATLAFAPSGTHVVELLGGSHVFSCFRFLAAEIGARYDALACTTRGPHMEVDPAQREEIVRLLTAQDLTG